MRVSVEPSWKRNALDIQSEGFVGELSTHEARKTQGNGRRFSQLQRTEEWVLTVKRRALF